MQIDQDTFKEGELNFGPRGSVQRDTLYEWRWEQFTDLFYEKYPEYVLMIYGMKDPNKRTFRYNIRKTDFKMRSKLSGALCYEDMETVNTNEFAKIIRKFRRYLVQTQNDGVVEKLFTLV